MHIQKRAHFSPHRWTISRSGANNSSVNHALTTLFVLLSLMGAPLASAAPKIASVDFTKLLSSYYKIHEVEKEIQSIRERVAADRRIEALVSLNEKRDKLIAEAKVDARDEVLQKDRLDEMQKLREQYQELKLELEAYREEVTQEVNELTNIRMATYTTEIEQAIATYCEKNAYDWLIDTTGRTNSKLPVVLYIKDATDVTEYILEIINADAPPVDSAPGEPIELSETKKASSPDPNKK